MLLVRTMEMCGQRTMAGISLQDGKQGGKYFSKKYSARGSLNKCTLPIAFLKPLFATAISTAMNDDIIPHIHDMSKTAITVSLDLASNDDDGSDADIYLLAVGTV